MQILMRLGTIYLGLGALPWWASLLVTLGLSVIHSTPVELECAREDVFNVFRHRYFQMEKMIVNIQCASLLLIYSSF